MKRFGFMIILGLAFLVMAAAAQTLMWHTETIDTMVFFGGGSSLAFGNAIGPCVSYYNPTTNVYYNPSKVYYACKSGNAWNIEVVTSYVPGYTWIAMANTSLVFDSSKNPHIVYSDYRGPILYTWKNGGTWVTPETVNTPGWGSGFTSLALDASGIPHISYYNATNGDLEYAYKNGGGWQTEPVDQVGDVGLYTSLALDASGIPHISYYDETNGDLKYAYKSGGGWQTEPVDQVGDVGLYTSLALDASGIPHISYYDGGSNRDLKHAWKSGGGWQTETVDSVDDVGLDTSLAIDGNGNPAISYRTNSTLAGQPAVLQNVLLKYAYLSLSPVASFTATQTNIMPPLNVKFTDTSTNNPTSWSWYFGDTVKGWYCDCTFHCWYHIVGLGPKPIRAQNPTHAYPKAGTYTVSLTATNAFGSDTAVQNVRVYSVRCPNLGPIISLPSLKKILPTP